MTFFPLTQIQDILDRKALILAEYHVIVPDTMPVYEFMLLSDKAHAVREERRKAVSEGKVYIP
jgi:hypothetical protein